MHTLTRIALASFALSASAACLGGQVGRAPNAAARIDSIFARFDKSNSPGCMVAVSQNGVIVFERGYGMANLENGLAITPASIFHVASVSKQFTAASILLLAQRGMLALDDDVRKYVPELPDYGSRITLRHLLTHTSGLRDQWALLAMAGWRQDDLITQDDVLGILVRQKSLGFPPGTRYSYSNSGYTLATMVVERVSGQSLRAFADSNIFRPLGMTHTHFHDDHTMVVPGRTSAYVNRADGWHVSTPVFDTYGATSLFTTVEDQLRWQQNFVDGRVGGAALATAMQAPTVLSTGDTSFYGLGQFIGRVRGGRQFFHDGADAGYTATGMRFPDQGLAVVMLCNVRVNVNALATRVAAVYLGDRLASVAASPTSGSEAAVSLSPDELARVTGLYYDALNQERRTVALREGKLVWRSGNGDAEMTPASATRFLLPGGAAELELVPAAAGGARRVQVRVPGQHQGPAVFEQVQPFRPTIAEMRAYAGDYVSAELAVTYSIAVRDSVLMIRGGRNLNEPLLPRFTDGFVSDLIDALKFTRDERGAITGFLLKVGRVANMRFERVQR